MESITCIFCHSTGGQEVIKESGYAGKKCDNCALIYIANRPSPQEVIDLYGHEQAHISSQSHITTSHFRYLHSRHTLARINTYKTTGKILEIGAGGGFFLQQACQAGFEPYALELNPTQANFIRNNGIPCEQQPLSASSFGQTKFDIIYHNDVISHFHDPHSVFACMHEKLNKDGIVVFETGNIADIEAKQYKKFTAFQYPDHLFFFGESTLKQLLADNKFNVLACYRYAITLNLKVVQLTAYLSATKSTSVQAQITQLQKNSEYSVKKMLRNLYHTLLFFTRYKLGALLPKERKPQTVIIIAQKQTEND